MLTGASALVSMLKNAGISGLFAYPGTSELALCDAAAQALPTVVNSRGDKEAVFMAAGGNLANSSRYAAVLHGARGLTNALGAIADVRRSEIPVLCIVGMASRNSSPYLPPHAEPELIQAAGKFARTAYDCSMIEGLDDKAFVSIIRKAIAALSDLPAGPVLLGIPQDLLTAEFVRPDTLDIASTVSQAAKNDISSICDIIRTAKAPLIFVDDYALRNEAVETLLARLSSKIGSPVFQVAYRRGPMLFQRLQRKTVPHFVGQYDPADQSHINLFSSADVFITIEDRNMYPRVVGKMPSCKKIAITSSCLAVRKNQYLAEDDVCLIGNVRDLLEDIVNSLAETADKNGWYHSPQTEDRKGNRSARAMISGLAKGIQQTSNPVIVDDSQMLGGLIDLNYDLLPQSIRIHGSHGAFVGSGTSYGVGLALGDTPKSVLCTVGDQGYTNGIQALAVAGENQAAILIVVCNNGASVSLKKQATSEGFDIGKPSEQFLLNNEHMDYVAVAKGYGVEATAFVWPEENAPSALLEQKSDELAQLVADLLKSKKPRVLELKTSSNPAFWEGVWNINGLEPSSNGDKK
ncbi:MAG: thiamine pyrophosphate-binding protein [Alphaproteobacteria bacterium]|nr:thiamine pyrophosphate-binding protein [Alphaproteobacteria bacterium]